MPIPGQQLCPSCLRPVRTPGPCNTCLEKEMRAMRGGLFCDHCRTNGQRSLIYLNSKTRKRYCVECRATFRSQLIMEGMETEVANKIMVQDFVLLNDPMKKKKR